MVVFEVEADEAGIGRGRGVVRAHVSLLSRCVVPSVPSRSYLAAPGGERVSLKASTSKKPQH